MISQKSYIKTPHGGGWFKREIKFLGLFLALISFSNLVFSNNSFALYTPTLSASVDNSAISVNGNQVINSVNGTTEIPFSFTVNTNNRTGYTATLSAETENTALINVGSATGAKIDSISTNLTLNNLPNNTWGYKFGGTSNYAPIPALSTPAQILQTAGKTNGNESNQLSIGMKLADNLESGNYQNKLILSFVSNPYTMHAVMTNGPDFNTRIRKLSGESEDSINNGFNNVIYRIERSSSVDLNKNLISIDDSDSDYQIFAWFDNDTKSIKYYSEGQKIFLNSDSSKAFIGLKELRQLDLLNFDTSNVKDMSRMFAYLENVEDLDLSFFKVKNVKNMEYMFIGMTKIKNLNLGWENESDVSNTRGMFSGLKTIRLLDLSNFDTKNVVNMSAMFENMSSLESIRFGDKFITKNVNTMGGMFSNDVELKTLDLSGFDTSNVTNMEYMFYLNHKLNPLNLSNFNTSRVQNMSYMFSNMWALENLDVSSFDTSNVTNMAHMFGGLAKITTLNLNNFNTSKVTDMSNMFNSMLIIENLSLPSFDTRSVVNMAGMFAAMEGLKNLNISSFDTSNVKSFRYMFLLGMAHDYGHDQVDHLEHIYVSKKFVISAMETGGADGIFHRRPSLTVGAAVGAGCTYVSSGTGNPFCIGSTWVVVP